MKAQDLWRPAEVRCCKPNLPQGPWQVMQAPSAWIMVDINGPEQDGCFQLTVFFRTTAPIGSTDFTVAFQILLDTRYGGLPEKARRTNISQICQCQSDPRILTQSQPATTEVRPDAVSLDLHPSSIARRKLTEHSIQSVKAKGKTSLEINHPLAKWMISNAIIRSRKASAR